MREQGVSSKPESETGGSNTSDTSEVTEKVQDGDVASASTESRPQTSMERHEELLNMVLHGARTGRTTAYILLDIREALVHLCEDSHEIKALLGKLVKQGAPKKLGRPRKKVASSQGKG